MREQDRNLAAFGLGPFRQRFVFVHPYAIALRLRGRVRVGANAKTSCHERPGSWVTPWTGDMGNSFPDLFRSRFAAPRPGRRKAREFFRLPHDATEVDVCETDQPVALLGLDDPDRLAGQRLADEDIVAVPLDRAIGAHATDSVIGIVPRFHDAIGIRSPRSRIVACRRGLVERLVRPVVIVLIAKTVKAILLLPGTRRRRLRGLLLECAMHAFVPSILLRSAWLDALQLDAELHPHDRQPAQASCPSRGKGRPVVRADRPRQPKLAERPLKPGL